MIWSRRIRIAITLFLIITTMMQAVIATPSALAGQRVAVADAEKVRVCRCCCRAAEQRPCCCRKPEELGQHSAVGCSCHWQPEPVVPNERREVIVRAAKLSPADPGLSEASDWDKVTFSLSCGLPEPAFARFSQRRLCVWRL